MKTPITYYGGKQNMLKHILPLVPVHNLYTEAFVGGAAVFFAKEPALVEVINDLNGELINFYRTIVKDFKALKVLAEQTLNARGLHEHAWYIYNNHAFFNNIERAWAVWVLSKLGFGGQISSSFGFDKSKNTVAKKLSFAKENFNADLKTRLEHTTIECDDALKIIARYDTPDAFHFVDPPYIGSNMGHYSGMFNEQNLRELLDLLAKIKGKFMLTMYPNETIRSTAKRNKWNIHAVERNITTCKSSSRRKQEEWIIMNYKPNQ
ncbi:restriction endonuclease subunit M [Bacteroidia bacterium]|nr:restriction endonuclease subunit M [Bacteroidia bacterium]